MGSMWSLGHGFHMQKIGWQHELVVYSAVQLFWSFLYYVGELSFPRLPLYCHWVELFPQTDNSEEHKL